MADGARKPAPEARPTEPADATLWERIAPGELSFKFPRLTRPIPQMPELSEESSSPRKGLIEALRRWLDGQV